jgi:hypothetical protein
MNYNGVAEGKYAAHRSSQFIDTIPPADKATNSTCKAKRETCPCWLGNGDEELDLSSMNICCTDTAWKSLRTMRLKKRPQARRTLASTLKIPIFVFFSCSSAESHTEKKRPTGGWDRPTMYSVHRAMQMHVDVLEMYSTLYSVLRSRTGYMQCAGSTYPSLKSHWAHTVRLNGFRMYKALAPVRVYSEGQRMARHTVHV